MTPFEQQTKEAFEQFMYYCSKPSPESLTRLLEFVHEDFIGYGTTSEEIFLTKDDLAASMKTQFEQAPAGFEYEFNYHAVKQIDEQYCHMILDLSWSFTNERGTIDFDNNRISCVFRKVGEAIVCQNLHASTNSLWTAQGEIIPGSTGPRLYEETSVLFTDFVGFTSLASSVPPKTLVDELNDIFAEFDGIISNKGLKKIKTIGDAYMAVSGIAEIEGSHAVTAVDAAKEMVAFLQKRNIDSALKWNLRVGIHSGSLVGGVIGRKDIRFDVWGDTVNLAARMEQASESNRINVSAYTYQLIKDQVPCAHRGKIEIKDGRQLDMYFVDES